MNRDDFAQPPLKDRLLARPRAVYQSTPPYLHPALGVTYYAVVAVVLRGLATLISAAFGESREFTISPTLFAVIVVSALISALAFGLVRSRLGDSAMSPWLLGQLAAWVFWLAFFTSSLLDLTPPRTDAPWELVLTPILFGLLLGFVFWTIRRKRYAA